MIRLIINADDLGSGPGRDKGILWAFQEGLISSASILANGPTFQEAAQLAIHHGLPIGVHLNLSEGRPLAGALPGITDNKGFFPGKFRLRSLLDRPLRNAQDVFDELSAQLGRVIEAGLKPDHLDTHQHFFLFPELTDMVIALAREHGIPALRLPLPAEEDIGPLPPLLAREMSLYRRLAPMAAAKIKKSGLFAPDGLLGMSLLHDLTKESLCHLFQQLSDGTWELMVHPGYPDREGSFSGPQRLKELKALASSSFQTQLAARQIQTTTFGALACAF
ncbi:ChbG/HpnK family deacetylase [Desulfuromonas sp. KJ2020]|uniref:carbohydrate deacetylase n=1 Tax=Desulfuromonas sp. KJ2020 TaxID=2919173 RepID=UPI0020A73E7C|nr:ChbG/HpnK family deacetylase [Desulfuromonas sp. KJ2020]MCP3177005.1 ChbG/HpnK family deacetylase [Desulfuromonas sp. KJ2020]